MPAPMRSPVRVGAEYRGSSAVRELPPVHHTTSMPVDDHAAADLKPRVPVSGKQPRQHLVTGARPWFICAGGVRHQTILRVHDDCYRVTSARKRCGLRLLSECAYRVIPRVVQLLRTQLLEGLLQLKSDPAVHLARDHDDCLTDHALVRDVSRTRDRVSGCLIA